MKALVRRVARVGDRYANAGCATCRAWPAIQIVGAPEGWHPGDPVDLLAWPRPPVCPDCGRDPGAEARVYVGIDLDAV